MSRQQKRTARTKAQKGMDLTERRFMRDSAYRCLVLASYVSVWGFSLAHSGWGNYDFSGDYP